MAYARRRVYRRKTGGRYRRRSSVRRVMRAKRSYMRSSTTSGNLGGFVITHREFVRDIPPSLAFTRYDFPIQPGATLTFPWLSQLAEAYEEYKIRACVFEYKSLCSDTVITGGVSAGMGSVILATNYNPNQRPFVDKRSMENYEGSSGRKPSQNNIHIVNVKKSSNPLSTKWVRCGGIEANEDLRLYDTGTFSLATVGQDINNGSTIGELWVAYEIEFFKPKYSGAIGSNLNYDHYALTIPVVGNFTNPNGVFGSNTAVAPTTGVNPGLRPNMNKGANTFISSNAANALNLLNFRAEHQGMTFLVVMSYAGSAATADNYAITRGTMTNVGLKAFFGSSGSVNTLSFSRSGITDKSNNIFWMGCFTVLASPIGPWNVQFSMTGGSTFPPDCTLDVMVMQIDGQDQPTNQ